MSPAPPHDDERCARLYRECKTSAVGFARGLLLSAGRNRYLSAFDAEELYDSAWETYYVRREYLESHTVGGHTACLNALIKDRFLDEHRRSTAQKRTVPGRQVDLEAAEGHDASTRPGTRRRPLQPHDGASATDVEHGVVVREELRRALARIRNPLDREALVDHDIEGLTYEEIAARQGITPEGARQRAERARRQARAGEPSETGETGETRRHRS